MKKNRCFLCIGLILGTCFGFPIVAQENTARPIGTAGVELDQLTMLARSSADYRVTPGDVYTLIYAIGTNAVTYVISVDSSYRIRVSNLGFVNGAGKTFMQVKTEAETIVTNNYPLSGVQLVLTRPAIFKVHVKGEVPVAEEVPVWALSRLSSLLKKDTQTKSDSGGVDTSSALIAALNPTLFTEASAPSLAPSSVPQKDSPVLSILSLRDVSVRSSNGQTRVYDLFKAQRLGDLSQDPYLRPGDEITFNRVKRAVTVSGEVGRPETYQLLDGENVKELIEVYGDGFTPIADKTRIELVRVVNSVDIAGEKIFITENDFANNFALEHYDEVTVPRITQLQPVMFIEGAVVNTRVASDISISNRLIIQFNKGETYASLLRKNVTWFTMVSDTENAYILRGNQRIPINLNPMLYNASWREDVLIQEDDVLIIPFRQYFITVAGAVWSPGRYPYIPDRDWEYYIALAGGFIAERNISQTVTITDINGKKKKKTDIITPETIITASTNHGLYYFNQYSPVVVTILTAVSTFLSIWAVTR
jgi:protein involved in polysaccharide export with SLBB domain